MDAIATLLDTLGPMRSSMLSERLCADHGTTPEAARKRLSRVRPPIRSYPVSLLPKREAFFYLQKDRNLERFWSNLMRDMRETESAAAAAIDGLMARGGIVAVDEFPVISGAPVKQKKQIPTELILKRLEEAQFIRRSTIQDAGEVVMIDCPNLYSPDLRGMKGRRLAEVVMLDGIREWARRLGMAGYDSIAIRGDDHPRMVGPYKWDLTGPSYLMPLRGKKGDAETQGFLVADAFAGDSLDHFQIRYFARKAHALRATTKVGSILPLIVARGFTAEALRQGHKAGLIMATPATLFGSQVGSAFDNLVDVLKNAAAAVATNPDRLIDLLGSLQDIEGKAGNLRGVLFELFCTYLVRHDGTSVDLGRRAIDQDGKTADIDVMCVRGQEECTLYECKGKVPGGTVKKEEVEEWIRRLPVFASYIGSLPNLREHKLRFEIWTSGTFDDDAMAILRREQQNRVKAPIGWKDGSDVRKLSTSKKEKSLTDAFDQHFFKHQLK